MARSFVYAAFSAALLLAACGRQQASAPPAADYRVYATNELSDSVTVIDGASRKVIATVPVGKRPRAVRASADGRTLYITLSGSPIAGPGVDEKTLPPPDRNADGIAVFDVAQNRVVRVVKGVINPEQIAVAGDGKLYAGSEDSEAVEVIGADGTKLASIHVEGEPEGLALRPDGKFLYATSEDDGKVVVIDTATNKIVASLPVGGRPRGVAFSPDGSRAYVTAEVGKSLTAIDAQRHALLSTVHFTGDPMLPMGVTVSRDGKRVYVATGRGGHVIAIDAQSMSPVASIAVGRRPWGIGLSPDDKTLYVANGPSNDVSVVDTATLKEIGKITAGNRPWGVLAVAR